jgi:hypothetical protein
VREMRIAFTFPSVSQLDAKHQGNDEVRPRISRIERIKTRDMSNKKSHQGYVFVRWERTLSPTRSDSQSVGHGLPGALSLVDGSKMTRRWLEGVTLHSRREHGGSTLCNACFALCRYLAPDDVLRNEHRLGRKFIF